MRVLFFSVVFVLSVAGCSRCGKANSSKVDAAVALQRVGTTDLRTALFTIFPEFRFAVITRGHAVVERRVKWKAPEGVSLKEAVKPYAEKVGLAVSSQGVHDFEKAPFGLDVEPLNENEIKLLIGLPIGQEDVGKLLQSPHPMTSEHLGQWIPRLPNETVLEETFFMSLQYQGSSVERTTLLVRQMIDLLLEGRWKTSMFPTGWETDGGSKTTPTEFTMTLENNDTKARVEVERKEQAVAVKLIQPLLR